MGQIVLLDSAVRSATVSVEYTRTWTERGAHFLLNVTAVPGVDTVTLSVEGLDALGNTYPMLTSVAINAAGMNEIKIHPDVTVAANVALKDFLPDRWRATVTHSAGTDFTYSLCINTCD